MTDRSEYLKAYRKDYGSRAKRVNLTFDLPEYRSVLRAAKSLGEPVATYVKRMALAAHHEAETVQLPEELLEELADLSRVIRTIANNVNQMARHSNRIAQVLDEQEVFLHIQRLEGELRSAVSKASGYAVPGRHDGQRRSRK